MKIQIATGQKGVKDISQGDLWFAPDITSKERTEIGEMLNIIDRSEMEFRRDLQKIKRETDGAYEALLKEKFKGKIIPYWMLRSFYVAIPLIRYVKSLQLYIFGNIAEVVEDVNPETGAYFRTVQLRDFTNDDGTVSQAKLDAYRDSKGNPLTKAEMDYYKMYTKMTNMFENHLRKKTGRGGQPLLKGEKRKNYIPQIAAGRFEMFLSRNMTSFFIANNYNSALKDIHVNDGDRIVPLGQVIEEAKIDQIQKGLSLQDWNKGRKIKRLIKQAERYLQSGTDAKGLPVVPLDNVENNTEADRFNRFVKKRSKKAEFASSFQIHASLNQYIEENLFYHGLDTQGYKYKGAMDLLPIIDGVINYQEFKGNPLAQKWVTELYKNQYVLKEGKKSLKGEGGKKTNEEAISEIL